MNDILGEALKTFLKNGYCEVFIERDDRFISREKIEKYFYTYESWPKVEKKILDKIEGPVLEIGCNVGMHLLYLKEKGIKVKGIDISPGAIRIARGFGLPCSIMDARKIKLREKFKTVLILYYGFGLAGNIKTQISMLKKLRKMADVLIASSIDALKTSDPVHKTYQEFNKKRKKPSGNITQVTLRLRYKNKIGKWYNLLFINPKGAKYLAEKSGWKLVKAIPENDKKQRWYYILE